MMRVVCFVILSGCVIGIAACSGTAETVVKPVRSEPLGGTTPVAQPGDWPWWRGPEGDGVAQQQEVPTSWSAKQNVRWQAIVPGRGHSSPCVLGDRVFLTTADEDAEQQLLLCYDRQSGEELWRTVVHAGNFTRLHSKNSHASATPACDGERVFTAFINSDALWVTAVDLEGNILWQQNVGDFGSEHGYGSSPVLHKSAVIVGGDNARASFVAAVDRASGKLVWKTPRERFGRHGSYGTPIVAELAGRPQLLLSGHNRTYSYDPDTGKPIWHCDGPCEVAACTMAFGSGLAFATGGFPEKEILAIRPDGTGEVTASHIVWRKRKGVTYVPSPVFYDGMLFVVNDQGIASCYEAATGKEFWQKRLAGDYSSSPVVADGRIFVTNERGVTSVLAAGPEYQLIAENDLGSGGFASPVICGGCIYIRTGDSLYCIGS